LTFTNPRVGALVAFVVGLVAAPVAHIAEYLTIAGKKFLTAHAKKNGRYDRRSVKLQHG
jgi:hypothetical protein